MIKWTSTVVTLVLLLWSSNVESHGRFRTLVTCVPASQAESALQESYGERKVAEGRTEIRNVSAELWLSKRTRTWTFMIRLKDDTLCVLGTGRDWHEMANDIPILKDEGR